MSSGFETRGSVQSIFDQMGKSVPLEIGFDRRLGGRPAVSLTSPIPRQIIINDPIPPITTSPNLDDVLTRSSIPTVSGMGVLPKTHLITTQVGTPGDQSVITAPQKKPEPCSGPGGLCPAEANQAIYDILMSKAVEISCACDAWEYYPMANPVEGEFKWKSDLEFIYRDSERDAYQASDTYRLQYSRWSPQGTSVGVNNGSPKLLLIHDVLDSRRSWWCCQKQLSPFVDTISVDLLGSGESLKPRGLNSSFNGSSEADVFPWSFRLHAEYLVGMAKVFWPNETFFVAGVGWGAQIAASMAAISEEVAGIIMINPPGFGKEIHPEIHYASLHNLARIMSDDDLNNLSVSFLSIVRECLLSGMSSSDLGHSGRDNAAASTLRLVLDQYSSLDRRRVLIDQMVAISNLQHQELPSTLENINGLEIDKIIAPCLVVAGGNDIIYPPEHRNLYPAVYYNSTVRTTLLPSLGHLAHIEGAKTVSETILDFIREQIGFGSLNDAFIGFMGASQGNERSIINGFRSLYGF